jgi:regulator of replication initiation timing
MQKTSVLLLLILLFASSLAGQNIPLREIDFSDAKISVAGPQSFYVRNLGFQGDHYAILLGPSDAGGWTITDIFSESENRTPRQAILDFATIRLEGENTLVFDGIFVNGSVYQGRLRVEEENRLEMIRGIEPSSLEAVDPARLRKLRETILETVAPEYEERIAALRGELRGAREQLDEQEEIIDEILAENRALEEELARRETQISSLEERITSLEAELDRATERSGATEGRPDGPGAGPGDGAATARGDAPDAEMEVSRLDLARVERDIRALREEAEGVAETLGDLREENEELIRENEELRVALEEARRSGDRRPGARSRRAEPGAGVGSVVTATELLNRYDHRLSRVLLQGFQRGQARMGAWRIEPDLAIQTDPGEYFSRFALPLEQGQGAKIFSFRGRSLETREWTGFGLHLFASEVEHPDGYGHGESLLIWFTRDREHYGNDHTYVQVYRSSDDVTMDRVAGGIIPEPITSPLDVEVLYQPEVGDITIAVNGEVKLLYKGWFGIDSGMEIALRTKGRGRFEDLLVRATP